MVDPKLVNDKITMLRWNIRWSRFGEVRDEIRQVKDKVAQQQLWNRYTEQVTQKNLYELKYDVTGGQDIKIILSNMKKDLK
jgi:hypothetical protein